MDDLSFATGSSHGEVGTKRDFEVRFPVMGQRSPFQWRFVGELLAEGSSVIVQGAFRTPRLLKFFFVMWFTTVGLQIAGSAAAAASSDLPQLWFLPLFGLVFMACGYLFPFFTRAMAQPAMQKVASQLDRCIG